MNRYKVRIRKLEGVSVRPEAKKLDGLIFMFTRGWSIEDEDSSIYVGDIAMIPADSSYPLDAPTWISLNDLELVES